MTAHPEIRNGEVVAIVRSLGTVSDPLLLYNALCPGKPAGSLLLESGAVMPSKGEKSLIVARSAVRARCRGRVVEVTALTPNGRMALPHIARNLTMQPVWNGAEAFNVTFPDVASASEEERISAPSPVDVLRAMACSHRVVIGEAAFAPLVAGVFAFDFIGAYERLPDPARDTLGWPDYEFWLPERTVWVNHARKTATAVFHVFGGDDAILSYTDAVDGISKIEPAGEQSLVAQAKHSTDEPAIEETEDAAFVKMVEAMKEHIRKGDVFQIVPSRAFTVPCHDPLAAYRRLRELNPSPYMFFLSSESGILFGASPETALKVDGETRRVEIRPIAGTRPRGRRDGNLDFDLDARFEAELRMDAKELAEHMMLVDLARNDVARISKPGSRRVERLLGVDRYSHVMHLVSHVSGELRDGFDGLSAYVATMNAGTLTGAPKIKATELLRLYEGAKRGPYGGAVGYFTMDGRLDTCIVIRSATVSQGTAVVRAGAGVVYDSNPRREADETRHKAEAVLRAIRESGGM